MPVVDPISEPAARETQNPDHRVVLMPFVSSGIGGATMSTAEMAKRLADESHYHPIVLTPGDGLGTEHFSKTGIETRNYPPSFTGSQGSTLPKTATARDKIRALPAWLKLFKLAQAMLGEIKPDILHLNEDRLIIPWGYAANRLGIPVLWHVRQERPSPQLDRLRLRLTDSLIFVAEANRSRFTSFNRIPPSATIHNVVNLERFTPTTDKQLARHELNLRSDLPTLVFLGHLVERKRPEWAIRASVLLQKIVPHQLLLVGSAMNNPERVAHLKELTQGALYPDNIQFLGMRTDIPQLLQASDVLTLPSIPRGEAFPRAIIEAMAAGVPAVATDIAGVKEAITDGENGILVPADDFEAYLEALKNLLLDEAVRLQLGQAALKTAQERFSGHNLAAETVQVYETLLKTR